MWFEYWQSTKRCQRFCSYVDNLVDQRYERSVAGCICNPPIESHFGTHNAMPTEVNLCNDCGMTFTNRAFLHEHQRRRHPRLAQVDRRHLPSDISKCIECRLERGYLRSLYNQHQPIRPVRPFECDLCPQQFKNIEARDRHKKTHHFSDYAYECEWCQRRVVNKRHLREHIEIHHKEELKTLNKERMEKMRKYAQGKKEKEPLAIGSETVTSTTTTAAKTKSSKSKSSRTKSKSKTKSNTDSEKEHSE